MMSSHERRDDAHLAQVIDDVEAHIPENASVQRVTPESLRVIYKSLVKDQRRIVGEIKNR